VSLGLFNSLTVQEALLTFPLSGSCMFEVLCELPDDATAPTGQATLTIAGDGESEVVFACVVANATAPETGSVRIRAVGGATGGFSAEPSLRVAVAGAHYDGDPVPETAANVLGDLVDEVGESIPGRALSVLEGLTAASWHRPAGSALAALAMALRGPTDAPWGLSARFLSTGELWAGVDTWPTIATEPEQVDPKDDGRCLYVAPRGLSMFPGMTILGKRIRRVQYVLTPTALRARLYYGDT
jgi:hypothetical protein